MQHDRSKLDWVDWPEQVFIVCEESVLLEGPVGDAYSTQQGAEAALAVDPKYGSRYGTFKVIETTLHRPSLRAVYGGPTLIEALWNEMDTIMERLMTGQESEDGGDKFRAAELAWVLAIVTNAYDPSVDRIRAETMRRWQAAEAEADAQEAALDPDEQEEIMTRPEGADQ